MSKLRYAAYVAVAAAFLLAVLAPAQEKKGRYGSTSPTKIKAAAGTLKAAAKPPDFNHVYANGDFGRHYLGAKGQGFLLGNDFGENHIASKLRYAGETDKLWVYDIVGLQGPQHGYEKTAEPGQFGVWYRPDPAAEFFFWFYASKEDNVIDPPDLK